MSTYIQKHKYHFTALLILIIIAGVSWRFSLTTQNTDEIPNSKFQIPNKISNDKSQTPKEYPISNIQYPNNQKTTTTTLITNDSQPVTGYQLLVTTTSTVYDAMKSSQLDFKTKTFSGLGEFVEEIGGLKNNPQTGKYWIYYINGKTAKLGISTQIIKPGDLIEWKYGTTDF